MVRSLNKFFLQIFSRSIFSIFLNISSIFIFSQSCLNLKACYKFNYTNVTTIYTDNTHIEGTNFMI